MGDNVSGADNPSKEEPGKSGIIRAILMNTVEYVQDDEPMSTELFFPTTKEAVYTALTEIRTNKENYENLDVRAFDSEIPELNGFFENIDGATIDEINYLAAMLKNMDDQETHIFLLLINAGEEPPGIAELINAAKNVGCYSFDTANGALVNEKVFANLYGGKDDIPAEYRVLDLPDSDNLKLYLPQIAEWIENKTGKPQQIITTHERDDIHYVDYDNDEKAMNMTLIVDADIDVKSISWSGEYGIGINVDTESSENGEKVHVILWTDSEMGKDERGYYMDAEGAVNGVLVISNPDIKVTGDVIKEMLAIHDYREPEEKGDIIKITIYNDKLYEETGHKEFVSARLSFPTTREAVQAALSEIGVDGKNYSRYSIDECKSDIDGLEDCIAVNADINELHYLASIIKDMDDSEKDILGALIDKNHRDQSVSEIINDIHNIPCYYLQPVFSEKQYGEFLLDKVIDEIGSIAHENIENSEAYGKIMYYLDEIGQSVDTKAYGRRIAGMEKGSFTDFGYLTQTDEPKKKYAGKEDIPEEYRVFAYPDDERHAGLYKIENTDLSDFIYKLHILPGDFTSDIKYNMRMLPEGIGEDYIILMNRHNIRITDAEYTYQDHTDINSVFRQFPHDTRAYLFHIDKREDGRAYGSIVIVDCGALSEDIDKNSVSFVGITADIKGSISQHLTRNQWENLRHIDKDKIQAWHYHFNPADVKTLNAHREDFFKQRLHEAEPITPETLFGYFNAEYMAEANYSQPGMIRVPLETAKVMLLNEDAPVFRLTPRSAEKLSMIAAATNALYTQNFREFAVKKEDNAGIDKMCRRETDKMAGKPPELDNQKKRDKPEQDL